MRFSALVLTGVVVALAVVTALPAHAASLLPARLLAEGQVPEPASLAVLGVGCVALLIRNRKRR
jgi:hypothetical protein